MASRRYAIARAKFVSARQLLLLQTLFLVRSADLKRCQPFRLAFAGLAKRNAFARIGRLADLICLVIPYS